MASYERGVYFSGENYLEITGLLHNLEFLVEIWARILEPQGVIYSI